MLEQISCKDCGQTKLFAAFSWLVRGESRRDTCKGCERTARKRALKAAETPEQRAARRRATRDTPGEKRRRLRERRAYDHRYPEKRRAREAVKEAIKSGVLERQPCSKCGRTEAQAHHEDYSRQLDVVWLCQPCHNVTHGNVRAVA